MPVKTLICTPCYGGNLHVGFFRSCMEIADTYGQDVNFLVTEGESNVTRARNNLVATFMRTDYDVMAMIDADIEISAEDFGKLVDIPGVRGAAVNMKRPDHVEALSCFKDGAQVTRSGMPDFPFEVDFLGTAVLFVDRSILETLYEKYIDRRYVDNICGEGRLLFGEIIIDDWLASEDYGFCELLQQQKMPIMCDPSVIVTHYGTGSWRA